MTSKYDTYWQDHLDAILALFDQAHTAGTSAPLPLTGSMPWASAAHGTGSSKS